MKKTSQLLVDGTPSAELAALLDGVRSVGVGGEPKFSPGVQQDLVRMVVGRSYAPALLQLCHLVHVAALAPRQRIELFFWGVPNARSSAYAGWVRTRLNAAGRGPVPLAADAAGVSLDYADGRFALSYGQMPLLVAVMELLVSALGYPVVLERVDQLLGATTRARVGEVANDLSRTLYGFLAPHLPTAHEGRRFERLVDHMLHRRDDDATSAGFDKSDFSRDDIDDAAILDFWLTCDDPDFRVYGTVLRGFLRLAEALEHAATSVGVSRAHVIGTDRDAGEIEPHSDDVTAVGAKDQSDPLLELQEPPASAVKALNQRERSEIAPVIEAGDLAGRLALSLLRDRVFGALQARLTEALRRTGADGTRRLLDGNEAPESYAAWVERYNALGEHVARTMLASLHLLAKAGRPETVHLLLACAPGIDLAAIAARGKPVRDAGAALRALIDPAASGPELAALMLRARRAFQSLSRAGFEPDAADKSAIVDGHAAAAEPLIAVAARVARFAAALARHPAEHWEKRFAEDGAVFVARLRSLYSADTVGTP